MTPEPMGRLAALTTHSLPALKHFLRGETEFRQGHYMEAFEAFRLATACPAPPVRAPLPAACPVLPRRVLLAS